MKKIKLIIREKGNPSPSWWCNFIQSQPITPALKYLSERDKVDVLKETLSGMNITFCVEGTSLRNVWLEFETEEEKNWFLLRWS